MLNVSHGPALQDADLLNIPEEIVQQIARPFTLAEWVKGPAQACRLLHLMKLPRVDLTCIKVRGKVEAGQPSPLHSLSVCLRFSAYQEVVAYAVANTSRTCSLLPCPVSGIPAQVWQPCML